ncbi:SAM-dependent methyltransferase [Actinocatenispora thailandica]|nr:SAM-dependent methyltransferase [Actinocatenispora thailandica]
MAAEPHGAPTTPAPGAIDMSVPNPARIYDYLLGGAHNFAVDRETADRVMAAGKVGPKIAWANRSFLRRAVRYMIASGIDQFLDLGSGIPTVGNVHEIAQAANPAARVVYVDSDPVAVTHARQLLADNDHATILDADLRDADAVLRAADRTGLLDLSRPLGILLVAVFHFVPDSADPAGILHRYCAAARGGGLLALSHYTDEAYSAEKRELSKVGVQEYQERTRTAPISRHRDQLAELLAGAGLDLVEPGIVWAPQWRPDPGDEVPDDPSDTEIRALVARVPAH